jgi:hypothetical protein
VALQCVRVLMRAVPYRRLLRAMERVSLPPQAAAPARPESVALAMRRAARTAPGSTCLARALTAYLLCRRAGIPAEIRIGVARGDGGALDAHAWVASGAAIVVGALGVERYVPLRASPG